MLNFSFSNRSQCSSMAIKPFSCVVLASLMLVIAAMPLMAQTPEPKPSQRLTEKDREFAINHLKASREKFVKAVAGLSETQLKFKSAPDRWSVAEVAEHITLAEEFLLNILTGTVLKTPATPDKERKITDDQLVAMITDRSFKAQAPEPLKPTTKWKDITETMREFENRRSQTIDTLKSTKADLRSHFNQFGNRGEIDALQWFLFISAHAERHTAQIHEVKADPNFPKK